MYSFRSQIQSFPDRVSAGLALASDLRKRVDLHKAIVVGLARGGVPVAYSVAKVLELPLDVLVVRKLGLPWHPEFAFGAIAPDGIQVLNRNVILGTAVSQNDIEAVEKRERAELERRERKYRLIVPPLSVKDKTVILVDDGLATGATMHAAVEWARKKRASQYIVAAPVASRCTCDAIEEQFACTNCVCHITPEPLYAVGSWYEDFSQVSDEAVSELLKKRKEEVNQKSYRVANVG